MANMRYKTGMRVRIVHTDKRAYEGHTGTVRDILTGPGTPMDKIPDNCIKQPYWYVVQPDDKSLTTIRFTAAELEPEETKNA